MNLHRLRTLIALQALQRDWNVWIVPSLTPPHWEVHSKHGYWSSRWSARPFSLDEAVATARIWRLA